MAADDALQRHHQHLELRDAGTTSPQWQRSFLSTPNPAHGACTLSQTAHKTFEVSELPVRAGAFVARKNWIVAGADDMHIR
jgi:hypothetical protein